jgi:hypothetical protein
VACCGRVFGWNIGSGKLARALKEVYAEALGVVREKDNETVSAVLERLKIGMPGSKRGTGKALQPLLVTGVLGTRGQGSSVAVAFSQLAGRWAVHAHNAWTKELSRGGRSFGR